MTSAMLLRSLARRTYATKPSLYGQPLPSTHPHLLAQADLTPGIPAAEYEKRRKQLMERLTGENSVVVSVAAPVKYMSANIFYKYRQASDFWYLTGLEEPDSAVLLEKVPSAPRGYRMTLFSSGKDAAKEKWDGAKTSHQDLITHFGADDALPISSFPSSLSSLLSSPSAPTIYIDLPHSPSRRRPPSTKSLLKYLSSSSWSPSDIQSTIQDISSRRAKPLAPEVAQLRAIKSPAEQIIMRNAADISARAHAKTMRFTRPGVPESTLAAHFEYLCAREGSHRLAYVPVVASGANALTIHYTANNHLVREGELVLIDAGCEYNGYASDITRTYPSSGTFSPAQAALYTALLSAQKSLIALCTASSGLSLHGLHSRSVELLTEEIRKVRGLEGVSRRDVEGVLYVHFVGHPIGIDLHESSNFDRSGHLKAGMVITVEPGIYVPPSPAFPKHFHNIGIRIEDEVLVGTDHPTVLSVNAPKEIADVEGACQGLLGLEPF